MRGINRAYLGTLRELLAIFPCVAVLGPRQCGKSTLIHQLGDERSVYDLERQADFDRIARDPDFFLSTQTGPIAIDEVQCLPKLFPALRVAIDAHRHEYGRFIITGSSSPDLLKHSSETLAGRVGLLDMSPFKASERWQHPQNAFYTAIANNVDATALSSLQPVCSREEMRESWLWGGYPEAVLKENPKQFALWMANYQKTYIERDIRSLFPKLNIRAYRNLITMFARLSGTLINKAEIAHALEVSQPTVSDYFAIAQGTYLWRTLASYSKNAVKRVHKMPKGYLRDSGLRHFLLHLNSFEKLETDPSVGRSWEVFIIEEILKGLDIHLIPYEAFYYRTADDAEIDLILEGAFGTLPIEIKYGTQIDKRQLTALRRFINERNLKLGLVINNADRIAWLEEQILQVPAHYL